MIQIGGVYTTFCQEEGILLQKYHDRNGRCTAILLQNYWGQGSIRLSWSLLLAHTPKPEISRRRFESTDMRFSSRDFQTISSMFLPEQQTSTCIAYFQRTSF